MVAARFPVEAGHLLMFARAIGDTRCSDAEFADTGLAGAVAPPTFVQSAAQFDPSFPLRPRPGQPWLGSGATPSGAAAARSAGAGTDGRSGGSGSGGGALHAEQRFDFVRPVRVGDNLSATQRHGRTWEKEGRKGGKLVFTESITEFRDSAGELVVTATAVAVTTTKTPAGVSQAPATDGRERG